MAEAVLSLEAGFGSLMQCGICSRKVVNHRMLPCQHLFCQTCLESGVKYNTQIRCIVCEKVYPLPADGVSGLPTNVFLDRYLAQMCEICSNERREIHCDHCEKSICKACHQKCTDIGDNERQQQIREITDNIRSASMKLKQIQKDTVNVSAQLSLITEQIDENAEQIIKAVKAKQKGLKDELREICNRALHQNRATFVEISSEMTALKALVASSDEHPQEWTSAITSNSSRLKTPLLSTKIDFLPSDDQLLIANVESSIGSICSSNVTWSEAESIPDEERQDYPPSGEVCNPKRDGVEHVECHSQSHRAKFADGISTTHDSQVGSEPTAIRLPDASLGAYAAYSPELPIPRLQARVFGSKGSALGEFKHPGYVAYSKRNGDIFVSDLDNDRIQKFNKAGYPTITITDLDIHDVACAGGLAVTEQDNLVVSDTSNHEILIVSPSGTIKTIGTNKLQGPTGIAVFQNKIYVCDTENHRIVVYRDDGAFLQVFGARKKMGNWWPTGIDIFPNGDIIVVDGGFRGDQNVTQDGKLELFSSSYKHLGTIGTGMQGTVKLKEPRDVTINSREEIFVSDVSLHEILVITDQGYLIRRLSGLPGQRLRYPTGVCAVGNQVIVADQGYSRVQILDTL